MFLESTNLGLYQQQFSVTFVGIIWCYISSTDMIYMDPLYYFN